MDKSRIGGALICVAAIIAAALFLWGIYLQNYWAVAIPVIVGFLGVLALTFWIGWTIAVTEAEEPIVPPARESTSEEASKGSS